jgi:hypothetical protein
MIGLIAIKLMCGATLKMINTVKHAVKPDAYDVLNGLWKTTIGHLFVVTDTVVYKAMEGQGQEVSGKIKLISSSQRPIEDIKTLTNYVLVSVMPKYPLQIYLDVIIETENDHAFDGMIFRLSYMDSAWKKCW